MATTSGITNTVTVTRTQIIGQAMKLLRVLPSGGTPTANDLTDCALQLNMILKMFQTKGLLLWLYDRINLPLTQNQNRYRLGPPDGDFPDYRPLRVMEGSTIRDTCSDNPADVSVIVWSRVDYLSTSNKQATGVPNSIYYDVQMRDGIVSYDPAYGQGILYVYPMPADSSHTLFLNVQRPIQDWTAADQAVDMPEEWYLATTKYLAAEIADMWEVPHERIVRLKQEASAALEYIANWGSQEWAPMTFTPDYQGGMGQGYRG